MTSQRTLIEPRALPAWRRQSVTSERLEPNIARMFAWFAVVVACLAFAMWGATLYDVLVQDS
jgi:hypothetical protein